MNINCLRHHQHVDEKDDDGGDVPYPDYFSGSLLETDSDRSIATSIMRTQSMLSYLTAPTSLTADIPYSTATPSLTNDSATSTSQQLQQQHPHRFIPPLATAASVNSYIETHDTIRRIEGQFGILSDPHMQHHQHQQHEAYMSTASNNHESCLIYPQPPPPPPPSQQQHHDEWVCDISMNTPASSVATRLSWGGGPNIVQPPLMIRSALQQRQLPFHQAPLFQHHSHHSPSTTTSSKMINSEDSEYLPSPSSASGEDAVAVLATSAGSATFSGFNTCHYPCTDCSEITTTVTSNFFPPLEDHHRRHQAGPSMVQGGKEHKEDDVYHYHQQHQEEEEEEEEQSSNEYSRPSTGATRTHRCIECTTSFGRRQDLKRHASTVHKRLLPFECQSCRRHFSRKDSMLRHERKSCHHRRKGGIGTDNHEEEDRDVDERDNMTSAVTVAMKQRRRRSSGRTNYQQQQNAVLTPSLSPSAKAATKSSSGRGSI
ncbi:hypothetical protein BX666DRAFT_2031781 [Dichotomocladium elegans]|nr:hypothetical protein BX666DRAFT_2031781 [Dichotomocladium elegans]